MRIGRDAGDAFPPRRLAGRAGHWDNAHRPGRTGGATKTLRRRIALPALTPRLALAKPVQRIAGHRWKEADVCGPQKSPHTLQSKTTTPHFSCLADPTTSFGGFGLNCLRRASAHPEFVRDVAITMRLNIGRRSAVAMPTGLPRYARNDRVGTRERRFGGCSRWLLR